MIIVIDSRHRTICIYIYTYTYTYTSTYISRMDKPTRSDSYPNSIRLSSTQ